MASDDDKWLIDTRTSYVFTIRFCRQKNQIEKLNRNRDQIEKNSNLIYERQLKCKGNKYFKSNRNGTFATTNPQVTLFPVCCKGVTTFEWRKKIFRISCFRSCFINRTTLALHIAMRC